MEMIELNLLPMEFRVQKRDLSWIGDRRVVYPTLALLLVLFAVFMAWFHINDELAKLNSVSQSLDAEIKKNEPLLKQIESLKEKLTAIGKKNTALKSIQVSKLRWIVVLENISTVLPKDMWLERILQDASNGSVLKMDGITYNFSEIAEYMLRLGDQEGISNVSLVSIARVQMNKSVGFRFSLNCTINSQLGLESAN